MYDRVERIAEAAIRYDVFIFHACRSTKKVCWGYHVKLGLYLYLSETGQLYAPIHHSLLLSPHALTNESNSIGVIVTRSVSINRLFSNQGRTVIAPCKATEFRAHRAMYVYTVTQETQQKQQRIAPEQALICCCHIRSEPQRSLAIVILALTSF